MTGSYANLRRTFVAVKPDGVQRRLVGELVGRFERKGLTLVGMKLASEELLREHYVALRHQPFYSQLVKYMSSGPVVAMVSAGHCSWCCTPACPATAMQGWPQRLMQLSDL
uniref:nucleoside-diphosphate kinase n=1 Tax=Dromaius novaehollandiae TaxID=8790 RepID=A0A8C4PDN1_DRONO